MSRVAIRHVGRSIQTKQEIIPRFRLKPDYSVVGTLFPRPTSHTGEVRKEHKKDYKQQFNTKDAPPHTHQKTKQQKKCELILTSQS